MVKFVSEAPKRGPGAVQAFPQLSAMAELGLDGIHPRLTVGNVINTVTARNSVGIVTAPNAAGGWAAGRRTRLVRT
ncbi:hypothetical protein ACVINU_007845 [Bradyrhizobium diazoefficiens]